MIHNIPYTFEEQKEYALSLYKTYEGNIQKAINFVNQIETNNLSINQRLNLNTVKELIRKQHDQN